MNDGSPSAPAGSARSRSRSSFFASRWRGEVSLEQILWRDMLFVGTAINVFSGFAGLMLFAHDAPPALSAAAYFGAVPYNVFLFAALWRAADREPSSAFAALARVLGTVWLVLSIVI